MELLCPLKPIWLKDISNLYYLGDELQSCSTIFSNLRGILTVKKQLRSISRKAWFLILVSVGYLLLVALFSQFLAFDNALMLAQLIYVFVLCLPLLFPSIGRRVGLYEQRCETPEENIKREVLYLEAAVSSLARFARDRLVRVTLSKAESGDHIATATVSGKRGDL